MSPGFLQQPVLSLYNKLGNEDTDSSYHLLTIFLPSSYRHGHCCLLLVLLPSSPRPARTCAIHMQIPVPSVLINIVRPQSSGNCYLHNCLDFTHPFIHIGRVLTSIIRISRAAVCAQVVHCRLCLHVQVLARLSIL